MVQILSKNKIWSDTKKDLHSQYFKVHVFWEGHKIDKIFTFDLTLGKCQIDSEDFVNELYSQKTWNFLTFTNSCQKRSMKPWLLLASMISTDEKLLSRDPFADPGQVTQEWLMVCNQTFFWLATLTICIIHTGCF